VNVLVDTSVWSLALRRRDSAATRSPAEVNELTELIREGRVKMIGEIRQEILSGVKSDKKFRILRDHLRAFDDLAVDSKDYEEAAFCFNRCRTRGIQGSSTDFLISAVSLRRELAVFTIDRDFDRYAEILGIALHRARG
jgi:predicted nucleic acid-binding protein